MSKVQELYNISRSTLIRWEKKGVIKAYKTPGGRRRYEKEEVEKVMGIKESPVKKEVILYARVSTVKQEEYLNRSYANFYEDPMNSGVRSQESGVRIIPKTSESWLLYSESFTFEFSKCVTPV